MFCSQKVTEVTNFVPVMDFYRLKWAITLWILSANSDILWELKSTLFIFTALLLRKWLLLFFFRMCCFFFIWWPFMAILVYLHKRTSEKPVLLRTPIVHSRFYNRFIVTIARMKCSSPWSFIIFLKEKKVFFFYGLLKCCGLIPNFILMLSLRECEYSQSNPFLQQDELLLESQRNWEMSFPLCSCN